MLCTRHARHTQDYVHCTRQCTKFRQAENNRLQGGVLHISWSSHKVTLPFVFFFSAL